MLSGVKYAGSPAEPAGRRRSWNGRKMNTFDVLLEEDELEGGGGGARRTRGRIKGKAIRGEGPSSGSGSNNNNILRRTR